MALVTISVEYHLWHAKGAAICHRRSPDQLIKSLCLKYSAAQIIVPTVVELRQPGRLPYESHVVRRNEGRAGRQGPISGVPVELGQVSYRGTAPELSMC
jgi:hypothetical protein